MSESFPIDSYATINQPGHFLHGSLGRVIPVTDDAARERGWVALHLLTGPKAYAAVVGPSALLMSSNNACYHCKFATPTNDRDFARCGRMGGVKVASTDTCDSFQSRSSGLAEARQ